MTHENVERLRQGFEHVERTTEFPPELAHPDFVWDTTTFPGGMQPATCVGVAETNQWLAEWVEGFDDWSIEISEVVEAGDQVVTVANQRASAKHGGPEVEMRLAQLWTFREGLIARMEMYADRAEAFRAAGLSQ
jgi:ketosteroid isomerase-like protein